MGNIPKLNDFLKNTKTPAGFTAADKSLTDAIKAQDKAIADLQGKLLKLAEVKRNNNKLSVQERTDNAIILQQQKQHATIVSEVAGAYRKLSAAEAQAARAVQDLIARGRLASQTQKQFNAELRVAQKEFDALNKRVLAADAAVGRWQRTGERTVRGANELINALGVSLSIAGVVALGKSVFDTTRELQSMDLALRQVLGSEKEFATVQLFLSKVAEDYGVDINVLTKSFTGFFASAKNAIDSGAISAKEIRDIFQSVSKAAGAMGLSVDQQQGAFLALSQMISKGNIQAEELRGQLSERLPGAFGILAKSMGVTEQQLNKMLKDGKVLAAEVLPAFAKELEKAYGVENLERVETLNAAVTRLGNSWTDFVRSLNQGDSLLSKGLTGIIDKLSEAVKGASIILEGEAVQRQKTLKNISAESYKDQQEYYKNIKDIDEAYIVRKNREFNEEIARLTEQIKINKEANDAIREASKSRYVQNGAEDLTANKVAIKAANSMIASYYGRIAAGTEILNKNNDAVKKNTELTDAQRKALEKAREEAAKSRYEREISDLERSKFIIEQDLKNEELSRDEKIKLQRDLATAEFLIITRKYQEQDRLAKGNFDKMKIAANEYITALDSLAKPTIPFPQAETGFEIPVVDEKQAEDSKQYVQDIIDLFAKWRDEAEASKEIMDDFIGQFTEDVFNNAGMPTLFKILNNEIEGFGENAMVTALAVSEAFQEAFNFMSSLSSQNAEIQKKNLEDSYNTQKSYINASVTDEEDKNEIIAELDRQLAIKKRAIAIKEAKAQKRIAQFNIAIDAAQGIVAAFKDGNIVKGAIFAAFIAGIAAVQLSALNNQQVPEYWKGTDNAPQGWAWTQERGAEIITDRQGRIKTLGSNDGAQLTPMAAGDKVFTADKSKELMNDIYLNRILGERGINNAPSVVNVAAQPAITEQLIQRMERAVTSMPQTIIGLTDRKLKVITKHNNQHIQDMTDRWDGVPKINP